MRLVLPLLALLVAAAPALAGDAADRASAPDADIRLGAPAAPPPPVDRSRVRAVERFLSARQEGSAARFRGRAAKPGFAAPPGADAAALYGGKGTCLIAFDFQDEGITPAGPGRFEVAAYLLFADESGQVVESRDETLTFAGSGGAWRCASLKPEATIAWDSDPVLATARSLGVSDQLKSAGAELRDWALRRQGTCAYSVADVAADADGRVVVQCLRFSADPGRRGFDVNEDPIVLTRGGRGVGPN